MCIRDRALAQCIVGIDRLDPAAIHRFGQAIQAVMSLGDDSPTRFGANPAAVGVIGVPADIAIAVTHLHRLAKGIVYRSDGDAVRRGHRRAAGGSIVAVTGTSAQFIDAPQDIACLLYTSRCV